jgi:small nuclear ribonucleoprotein (snRNP)-like protein
MKYSIGSILLVATHDGRKFKGTVVGYDIHKTKYQLERHSQTDDLPMEGVIEWAFPNEIEYYDV